MLVQLLPTQHPFAVAAHVLLRCSAFHQSGHSRASNGRKPKPYFRRSPVRWARRGQTGFMHVQLLLTKHFLACTETRILQSSGFRQSGVRGARIGPILESAMIRTINLSQLTIPFAAQSRLADRPPLLARKPLATGGSAANAAACSSAERALCPKAYGFQTCRKRMPDRDTSLSVAPISIASTHFAKTPAPGRRWG